MLWSLESFTRRGSSTTIFLDIKLKATLPEANRRCCSQYWQHSNSRQVERLLQIDNIVRLQCTIVTIPPVNTSLHVIVCSRIHFDKTSTLHYLIQQLTNGVLFTNLKLSSFLRVVAFRDSWFTSHQKWVGFQGRICILSCRYQTMKRDTSWVCFVFQNTTKRI